MLDVLSELDRRIVGALQVDGRASWSAVARALDEPLRTVARRGRVLLESGMVSVVGLRNLGPTCVIEVTCKPSRLESLARELAEHPGVVYVFVLANPSSVLVEVHEQLFDLGTMTLSVIPAYAGVLEVSATPVLHYFKTNADWQPGLLSAAETALLGAGPRVEESTALPEQLDAADSAIVQALERDGRASAAELAEVAGVTEPTARKRLGDLQQRGALATRVLVDPRLLGFRIETCVRIDCAPAQVREVGEAIAALPESRYVAELLGERSLIAHFAADDLPHVRRLLHDEWTRLAGRLHPALITRVVKRSGRLVDTVEA
ncbi:Lrp/AsnC family transcriptional regulator [Leucobacter chromiiresistens]|uniref:DNA-binding transcriptional regulator, Lrp family n=1 Tax=Leucobacter chromiiresistens TaxID=1079994 RepID=A0A1H0Y0X6_9MICO|nr:Lrp/AsnC family transcriptional regulator [Leucobacter chromiiresistens]SDQ08804.1 DNA-binding transcriptional regulator, Lrp family [Leucobacter chromiiresistens]